MARQYYSGINSNSFWRAYNANSGTFEKSKIEGIRYPEKTFLYDPLFKINTQTGLIIHHHCCGQIAMARAEKWGGSPLVFSVEDQDLDVYHVEYEIKEGKTRKRRLVTTQPLIKVRNIYVVTRYIKNLATILTPLQIP